MTHWAHEAKPRLSAWAREAGLTDCHFYRGNSMGRSFCKGDLLYFWAASPGEIAPGDVVIFSAAAGIQIVHRAIRVGMQGIVTKGDACLSSDATTTTAENLLGRVEWLQRGRRRIRVRNGARGRIQHRGAQFRARLRSIIKSLFAPGYRRLRNSRRANGFLLHLLKPKLKLAAFKSPEGVVLRVIYKKCSIARLHPGMIWARVERPYDLWLGLGGEMAQFLKYREVLEQGLKEAQSQLKKGAREITCGGGG